MIQAKLTGLGCTENGGTGKKSPAYKHNGIFQISHHLGALSLVIVMSHYSYVEKPSP